MKFRLNSNAVRTQRRQTATLALPRCIMGSSKGVPPRQSSCRTLSHGADVSATDAFGRPILVYAVMNPINPEVLRCLLESGADPNAEDDSGMSVLQSAVYYAAQRAEPENVKLWMGHGVDIEERYLRMVQQLLDFGADATFRDSFGQSALFIYLATLLENRTYNADLGLVRLLLENGNQVTMENDSGLLVTTYAMRAGINAEVIRLLLEHGVDASLEDEYGSTLLHLAASYNSSPEVFNLLLEKGVDVASKDDSGSTVLHLSVRNSDLTPQVIILLLDSGADVNVKDQEGNTPLHLAATRTAPSTGAIELLLARGADKEIRNNAGYTPCDIASTEEATAKELLCP